MDHQSPSTDKAGKRRRTERVESPADKETQVVRKTVTPDEADPSWKELGATRVIDNKGDSDDGDIHAPNNYTVMSPAMVLGKDILALGDYQLIKKLGEGAMGAVYKAHQASFDRVVALKILFAHVAKNQKLVNRFEREARVMFELDHPNIVTSHGTGCAEGCHYVAMEYISGQSVQKWMTQLGKLPVGDALRIAIDCAKALSYAHAKNVIHRDIKPDNILLTNTGIVKVADLGMVKTTDDDMSLTQTGHAVGTPWYMPLEQARNAKTIDGRSDIYALGCTLYAMLTGHPPFIGETLVDVIKAKEHGTFAPARQFNPNVPERLDLILAKMTAKLPKYRYETCDDLIKDLEGLELANKELSFLSAAKDKKASGDTSEMDRTTAVEIATSPRVEQTVPADPNLWYVQMKTPDGKTVVRKFSTTQLQKMLEEGTIAATARISHSPSDGFRAAATFKEFQGQALTKMTKKAADKQSARYRQMYKKIEEEDRKRDEKTTAKPEDSEFSANTRYWLGIALAVIPIAAGIIAVAFFIYWLASNLFA